MHGTAKIQLFSYTPSISEKENNCSHGACLLPVGLIKICVRVLCNGPLETGHLRLTCPFTECNESGLWSKVASCRESLGTSNQPSRQGRSYMVVRVVRGPPVHTRPIDIGKFSQIGYVRPSVRGLREYALRPFCAPSYFSVRPLCAPSYPLDELCFIEFDIPNDSGGGGSAAGAGRRVAVHVSHLQVYVSTSSSN